MDKPIKYAELLRNLILSHILNRLEKTIENILRRIDRADLFLKKNVAIKYLKD